MSKQKLYSLDRIDEISAIGKALSSPIRLEMLKLLQDEKESLIIVEIAKALNLPASSTAFHLKILEEAGLVRMEMQPGFRGVTKVCTRKMDQVLIDLKQFGKKRTEISTEEMAIGAYSDCEVYPTCGIYSVNGVIGMEDRPYSFYLKERVDAGILWSSAGYVEYKFANRVPENAEVKKIWIRMELCSEAPGYKEDWKSDITIWINGKECGTWTSPGDFGDRKGCVTPSDWFGLGTQYGLLVTMEVDRTGGYLNGTKVSDVTIDDLCIMDQDFVKLRIGNKPDAKYVGGFALFGKEIGDYAQDIILNMEYL